MTVPSLASLIAKLEAVKAEIVANAAMRDELDGAGADAMQEAESDILSAIDNLSGAQFERRRADEIENEADHVQGCHDEMKLRSWLDEGVSCRF